MRAEQTAEATPTERPISGLPVDTGILFANHKGVYQRGIEKTKTKLLRKLGFLANFLDADEKIVFVTTGCSPYSTFELLTMGAVWVSLLKRSLFVFTNKRLFLIPTTWQLDYRGSIAQILYQDCKRLQVSGSGLVAEYHTGKKDRFPNIPRRDRQIIKHFQFVTGESDQRSETPQRNHLCPNCTQILPTRAVTCPSCGLEFKSRAKSLTRSILLPGGGYFYTGHPFLGACDALGEAYLVILNLVVLFAGLRGDAEAMATLPVFLVLLAIEKIGTVYHSNSFLAEFIPENLKALLRGRPVQRTQPEPPPIPAPPQPRHQPEDVLSLR
ncbi:MAG: zinc ribbon domain-containing protein [Planctomycetes bacterium]|nr:zinc ribbon domain-containing protein [Planctomycetota bacterium]